MIIIDTHCDTLKYAMEGRKSLYSNDLHNDFLRMKEKGQFVQFFAIFIEQQFLKVSPLQYTIDAIDYFYNELNKHSNVVTLCRNYNDIMKAFSEEKSAALLSIEDGCALQGDLSILRVLYKLGIRSICLTWNHKNVIAVGIEDASKDANGLSQFGIQTVREMNRLGMLVDVSHLSEPGFWDVVQYCKSPFIASHSNAAAICGNERNLTDQQIIALKNNGGVMGINLYPEFLNDSGKADISDVVRHIEHVASIAGIDCIGLGCDFDGIEEIASGITGVQDIDKLFNELLKFNYPEKVISKIAGENFLRVIKQVL
ncbi:MAG: dipeptidase [Eubacteriales bacterium]|nr:dipeptidase [Eubacteriales bacterium]